MKETDTMTLEEKTEKTNENILPVCFVCSGNTCRSPMAAAVYNDLYIRSGKTAVSAGTSANGSPINEKACTALSKEGIESKGLNKYKDHISRNINRDILEHSSKIVAMTSIQMMQLIMTYPEYISKYAVMPNEIPDPFGQSQEVYDNCLKEIEKGIKIMFGDNTI